MSDDPTKPLRVALPNKGRLSEKALELFEQAGLKATFRADRALMASLGPDFQAILVRAADIPEFLADGAAEVGVTGADLVAESGRDLEEVLDLGFGSCRLVVAVKDESGVTSAADLPAGTRVATSFPRCATRYFESLGTEIEIAPVSGATEIAPHLGVADVIVDLTSTGSTPGPGRSWRSWPAPSSRSSGPRRAGTSWPTCPGPASRRSGRSSPASTAPPSWTCWTTTAGSRPTPWWTRTRSTRPSPR